MILANDLEEMGFGVRGFVFQLPIGYVVDLLTLASSRYWCALCFER